MKTTERTSAKARRTSGGRKKSIAPKKMTGLPSEGRSRVVISAVRPVVDRGQFPVKRVVGESVDVEADLVSDGHDRLGAVVRWRRDGELEWRECRLREDVNDLWCASFDVTEPGVWHYAVTAWVDPFITWQSDLKKRVDAGQEVSVDLEIGAGIIRAAAKARDGDARAELSRWAERLSDEGIRSDERARVAGSQELSELMWRFGERRYASESESYRVIVDRTRALFSTWYELFPRSAAIEPGRHGTFQDVEERIPYVANMGFDVLYLPPIHPIGHTARKGKNNAERADANDVGSPWAIGSEEGGHMSVHPNLGTLEDFDRMRETAEAHGLEVALDIAFQCSPDHPYVQEHPEWFRHRPDGTIQYAENPPKKYQDIYPFDFETEAWESLWHELESIFLFWAERGVRIFRVDNPHTKAFEFWDWVIGAVKAKYPDALFLSEAFTRPKRMYRLAKGGFTQSYTYFAWRNGPGDLRAYMEELSQPPVCDFFRPNFWPNTPDILTEYLQTGGRDGAMARLVLAATLSSSYGIYGPTYELSDFTPRAPGVEENIDNEKYQIRDWHLDDRWSLAPFIRRVNRIRRENPALQQFRNIQFHDCENPAHVAYSKRAPDGDNVILCVVNTNPFEEQWGTVHLHLDALGLRDDTAHDVTDLLGGGHYRWHGRDPVVGLPPGWSHIFRIDAVTADGGAQPW